MASFDVVTALSDLTGEERDTVGLFLCLVSCLPLALIYRCFLFKQAPAVKHVYFCVTGLGLLFTWLGWEILHVVIPSLLVYASLCIFAPSRLLSLAMFTLPMVHLLWGFVSISADGYHLGWMAPAAINIQALFALTMDVSDNRIPVEKRSADQKKLALRQVPGFLEFIGFKFSPWIVIIGPLVNFKEYDNFVHNTHLKDFDTKKFSLFSETLRSTLQSLFESLIGAAIMFTGDALLPNSFFISEAFAEYSWPSRYTLLWVNFVVEISKYICAWKVMEAASCISTLGYSGSDKTGPKFELCRQVYMWAIAFPTSFAHCCVNFNCATHRFVKRYVFKRLVFLGNIHVSMVLSMVYIAIWHGTHFGYFWAFVFCETFGIAVEAMWIPIVQNITGIQTLASLPAHMRIPLHFLCMVYSFLGLGYGFTGMTFLNSRDTLLIIGRVHYYFHAVGLVLIGLYFIVPARLKVSPVPAEKKKE